MVPPYKNEETLPMFIQCSTHTLVTMFVGTVRSPVIGVRGASVLSSRCRQSSDPVVLKPAPVRLPGPRLQSQTLTHRSVDVLFWSMCVHLPFVMFSVQESNSCRVYFQAREAGVDPGVCRSGVCRPGSGRLRRLCCQEGGLQKQVS